MKNKEKRLKLKKILSGKIGYTKSTVFSNKINEYVFLSSSTIEDLINILVPSDEE